MKKRMLIILSAMLAFMPVTGGVGIRQVNAAQEAQTGDFVIENNVLKKYNGKATEVIIPDGVKTIGKAAFRWNSNIKKVTIPDSVKRINQDAFYACNNLKEVIGAKNVTYIGVAAFSYDRKLKTVNLSKVTNIGNRAFYSCEQLNQVNLEALTEIGEEAFSRSGLKAVDHFQPKNIVSAGSQAFLNTEFADSYWGKEPVVIAGTLTDGTKCEGEITLPEGVIRIADYAFAGNRKIRAVNFSKSVTEIGAFAFSQCDFLKYVRMENQVTKIGEGAFVGCKDLIDIRLSDSLAELPNGMLQACQKLTSVTMPAKWTPSENVSPFSFNTEITAITLPADVKNLPVMSFGYVDKDGKIYLYGDVKGVELVPLRPVLYTTEINEDSELYAYAQSNGYELKKLSLKKTKLTLETGQTYTLRFNSDAKASWKSSNKSVATVSTTGNIYAKKAGTATITATIYGKTYRCKVTVKEATADNTEPVLGEGDMYLSEEKFPDSAFRNLLSDLIDKNEDGILTYEERCNLTELKNNTFDRETDIEYYCVFQAYNDWDRHMFYWVNQIELLEGIQFFPSLKFICIDDSVHRDREFDGEDTSEFKYLSNAPLVNMPELENVQIYSKDLKKVRIENTPKLRYVYIN